MVARAKIWRNMFVALMALSMICWPDSSVYGRKSVRLRDVHIAETKDSFRMNLLFDGRPDMKLIKSGDPTLIVYDFLPVVFPSVRKRYVFSGRYARQAYLAQNDRRRTRLALRVTKGTGARLRRGLKDGPRKGLMLYWLELYGGRPAPPSQPAPPRPQKSIVKRRKAAKKRALPNMGNRRWTVVIDPGHGGKDPGALGAKSKEKDIVLEVGLELARALNRFPFIDVRMTRTKDKFIKLRHRSEFATKCSADLFLSLHCNSSPRKKTRGMEIYTLSRDGATDKIASEVAAKENSVLQLEDDEDGESGDMLNQILCSMLMTDTLNQSVLLAGFLEKEMAGSRYVKFRSHKKANFYVLRLLKVPAVLVELGFISNKHEEARMKTRRFVTNTSTRLAAGVSRYLTYAMMREGEYVGETTAKYYVRRGDTLRSIATRYKTTVTHLMRLNRLKNENTIRAGQFLKVPACPIAQLLRGSTE